MAQKRLKKYSSALLPAHEAAAANDVPALREMFGGDLPAQPSLSEEDETPLHSAAREGADDTVDWLLKNTSIDPQCYNKMRETPAHLAAAGGHLKCLMKLVNADPARRDEAASTADSHGLTPLHHATMKGKVNIIRWLLEEFGDTVFAENENGQLSVHFAASSGNLEGLKLLLQHSGLEAANRRDQNGTTAVYFAAQEGRLECLQYLVREAGADPLAKARDGMTAIHAATQGGHLDTVRWLIKNLGQEKMSEPSDEDGATPVHYAAATGHYNILKWFLETNGSHLVHLRDAYGGTPAHDAAEYDHLECLKLLVEHGADLYALDHEGMSPYSLAIRDMESETAEFVMLYAESGPGQETEIGQDVKDNRRQISQQNREMESSDDEEIKLPSQNRRLSNTLSQTSMPRTLADDAFEITEARKEVEMALQSGSGQSREAFMAPAGLKERHLGRLGAADNAQQSGSELDLVFSVEDCEPGKGMPDTTGVLKVDSKGILKMSAPEHYEGPRGGVYTHPQHVPSRKQKKAKSKSKLTETEGIDSNYVPEREDTGQNVNSRKLSTSSGPHYAEPVIMIRQPGGQKVDPKKLSTSSNPHYTEPIVVVRQPGGPVPRRTGGNKYADPDYDRLMHPVPIATRAPPGRRPPYVEYRPPQARLLVQQQQRMHHESQYVNPWMERQPIGHTQLPHRGQHPQYRGIGPFDHEADIILIPRVIKRYPRLRTHDQPQFQPKSVAYQSHSPDPPGSSRKQPPRNGNDNIKFSTLPSHIDYSRRPYDRMSHYQRAHPGYRPPTDSDGQHLRHRPSDKSRGSEYSTSIVDDRPEERPTPKTRKKNKISSPIPVSDSDDVLYRHTRVGDPRNRPHSEIIAYYGPQRGHPIPRSEYPQNGPVFDPYRAQSMSALDSSLDHKLVKQREFSSHNELTARHRMYEDDVDDFYSVSNALAYAAIAVLAAVAGIPGKQRGPMMASRGSRQKYGQMNAVVPSKGPGRMVADAYATGAAFENPSAISKSQHFNGQKIPAQYLRQEQRMSKGSKGKATEQSNEKKKSAKNKKMGHKTSHSSIGSSLKPVPEDEFEYNYEMERSAGAHWTEEDNSEEHDEKEKGGRVHRVSGKDISEAYKNSKQNVWATVPISPSAPTLQTSQATSRVSPAGTKQFKVWSGQPQHPMSSTVQIQSRQPGVSLSTKSRPEAGESEDNLDVWWSTATASGYSYPKHPSFVSTGIAKSHHHTSASAQSRHNTVIDYHVASGQPQFRSVDEVSASVVNSLPRHGVVGVSGIHVGHESATHFSTVEAAASSRPRTAEAQASVVVAGPPPAPPVPSHLVASGTGTLDTRLTRQASPPTTKVLSGAGTALEPVEEERLQTVGVRSASKRSTKRSTGDLDDYLDSMTSAHIKDELSKKEAELMQLQSLHRSFSGHGHKEDEDDSEMMAEPISIGARSVQQDEAMLVRQETLRQRTEPSPSHVEQLDRELQELKMLVPQRDDFMTPQGSQPTSPDSSIERGFYSANGGTSPMHQEVIAAAEQRAVIQTVAKGPGAEEGQGRFAPRNVSISHMESPLALHTDGRQGRKVNEATIESSEDSPNPNMVRSGSSYNGMYYHFDGSDRDTSYKIGAIGPSVLAEKLKLAKATEGRNEAIADIVVRQTGQRGSLSRVTTPLDRQVVAVSQVHQQDNTLAVKAEAAGLGAMLDEELLEMPAKFTPVLPHKMAVLVKEENSIQPSRAEHSDEDEDEDEDEYTYVSVTGNKIETKEAVVVHGEEIPENDGSRVAVSSLQDDEDSVTSETDDIFIAHEGEKAETDGHDDSFGSLQKRPGERVSISSTSSVSWKWQHAAQRSAEKKKLRGADEELEKVLKRRQQFAAATQAIMTPVSNRKKRQKPQEQGKEGINI